MELLTVVAIISILSVLAASALGGALSAYRLAVGADALAGRLESASLLAASRNQVVQFRLIRPSGQDWQYVQVLVEDENGSEPVLHGATTRIPDGVRVMADSTHGGMLGLPVGTVPSGNRFAGASYTGVKFHPGGRVKSLSDNETITPLNNFLTLTSGDAGGELPANWIAIRVDAKSGAVSRFQP